jgi:hypothetical protein
MSDVTVPLNNARSAANDANAGGTQDAAKEEALKKTFEEALLNLARSIRTPKFNNT